ncbi:hypothetical protein SynPROS91_00166 [Synechococcus sp. PROS-9-1]|nr:hypothetical protein SynPROS91_00166 [Synechococcus sp. PROS-9-1]
MTLSAKSVNLFRLYLLDNPDQLFSVGELSTAESQTRGLMS